MTKIMKTACSKIPVQVKSDEDVKQVSKTVAQGKVCPIFTVSSLTGEGIENLRNFLRLIEKPAFRIQKEATPVSEKNSDSEITT